MKHRIVEITKEDGSKQYRCERTGLFRKNHWRVMRTFVPNIPDLEVDAVFSTLEEAQKFLHIHPSQKTKSENTIWER